MGKRDEKDFVLLLDIDRVFSSDELEAVQAGGRDMFGEEEEAGTEALPEGVDVDMESSP
jgi:hypothetical protein